MLVRRPRTMDVAAGLMHYERRRGHAGQRISGIDILDPIQMPSKPLWRGLLPEVVGDERG